jgi:hypothetical protein
MGSSNAFIVLSGVADHGEHVIEVWTTLAGLPAPQGSVIDAQNAGRGPLPAVRPEDASANSSDVGH